MREMSQGTLADPWQRVARSLDPHPGDPKRRTVAYETNAPDKPIQGELLLGAIELAPKVDHKSGIHLLRAQTMSSSRSNRWQGKIDMFPADRLSFCADTVFPMSKH